VISPEVREERSCLNLKAIGFKKLKLKKEDIMIS